MYSLPKSLLAFIILASLQLAGCQSRQSPSTQIQPPSDADAKRASANAEQPAVVVRPKSPKQAPTIAKPNNKSQPTTPSPPRTAWEAITQKPGIEPIVNRAVKAQVKWYVTHPSFLSQMLARSEPFLGYVIEELDRRDLPRALALLPVLESRYDPHAVSKSGATGTWQFMPATAAHFNIKTNWWFDGRKDVITSTDAALTYLGQLSTRFDGDWLLALASYNAGAGNVGRAIEINRQRRRPTDFWTLRLPDETTQYVPRLLALLNIIENSERYGVELPNIAPQSKLKVVNTSRQIDVIQTAKLAGLSEAEFRSFNPGLLRWASDPQGPHRVLVPVEKVKQLSLALQDPNNLPDIRWRKHKVAPGETISEIARAYKIPTDDFKQANSLSTSFIRVGQNLVIPQIKQLGGVATIPAPPPPKQVWQDIDHVVKSGNTLWQLAKQYDTPVAEIMADNKLEEPALKVGQVLSIRAKKGFRPDKVNYLVQAGDSLYGIAKHFNVSINQLASWNGLDRQMHIKPGQRLTLYLEETDS